MRKSAKIILWLSVFLALAGLAWAVAVTYQPYGIATPRIYQSTYGYRSGASSYYLATPTLSANDTIVGLAATQTLTNKTLTAPTLTAVSITGTSTIGAGMTITSPAISGATITGSSYAGTAALTTGTVSTSLSGGGTATSSGFLMTVSSKAAGYSMTAADSGKVFYVSAGAELDLPDAVVGRVYTVVVASSVSAVINPLGADTIVGLTNAGGDSITNTGDGTITLVCAVADKWHPVGTAYGTWSDSD